MPWLWIAGALVVLVLVGTWYVWFRLFQNVKEPPRRTPAELGLDFETWSIPTQNHRRLQAWWIPAKERQGKAPVLVLVHGWSRNSARMLPYIEALHPAGFHLLAFDARNHGASDADGYASVVKFAEDIQAVLHYLEEHHGIHPQRVGLIGLSIGGAASLLAAARESRLGAVVTVGAFAHPGEIIAHDLEQRGKLLQWLTGPILKLVEWRIGFDLDAIAPEKAASTIRCPVLCIHGTDDKTVPVEHGRRLEQAFSQANQQLWLLPGRGHSDCHLEPGFWERVTRFSKEALSNSSPGTE